MSSSLNLLLSTHSEIHFEFHLIKGFIMTIIHELLQSILPNLTFDFPEIFDPSGDKPHENKKDEEKLSFSF